MEELDLMAKALEIVEKFAKIGGALWLLWGVVVLAGGMKDKTGPQIQSGIWQIVGGGMILATAVLFSTIIQ